MLRSAHISKGRLLPKKEKEDRLLFFSIIYNWLKRMCLLLDNVFYWLEDIAQQSKTTFALVLILSQNGDG